MKVVFLGTAGYHPNNRRHTACLMLPELGVVFDAGTGFYRVTRRVQTRRLDICLSHAHLDHVAGLTFLLGLLYQKPLNHVRVHGEPAKLEAIACHLFSEPIFPVPPPFEMIPLDDVIETEGGARITNFAVEHPGGAVGYRLEAGGRSMAYVTDTTASLESSYLEHIRGVDLLIHECNFPDGREDHAAITGHSCTTPVAQVAKAAEVGRLVLTHFDALDESDDPVGLATARSIFPRTDLAEDEMEIEI